jgi:hypothetical protein
VVQLDQTCRQFTSNGIQRFGRHALISPRKSWFPPQINRTAAQRSVVQLSGRIATGLIADYNSARTLRAKATDTGHDDERPQTHWRNDLAF